MQNGNGQGFQADPQDIINGLLNRIANLTMELAVKDAYILKLEGEPMRVQQPEEQGV